MNLIDSSAWIAYLRDDPAASRIEKMVLDTDRLVISTIVLYEVYRQLLKTITSEEAFWVVAQMQKGRIVPVETDIAFHGAEISRQHKLGMADALIYATAIQFDAQLVTLDNDFRGLPSCLILS